MTSDRIKTLSPEERIGAILVSLLGAASFLAGLVLERDRAWLNLLLDGFFSVSLALGALVFLAIQYLTRAQWSVPIRRVPEAMAGFLPVGALLLLLVNLGSGHLYPWADPAAHGHGAFAPSKAAYLTRGGFLIRMLLYLGAWWVLARILVLRSRSQTSDPDPRFEERQAGISALFCVVFALTFSLASVDWLMSLSPHWTSTLFPWYVFSGAFVSAIAMIAFLVLHQGRQGSIPDLTPHILHDLGKYLFAFSFFWGYLWFCQYMLIWYSNIPEEVTYFALREAAGWRTLFLVNLGVNLFVPFLLLLPAAWKRSRIHLAGMSLWVLGGHWLDVYLMVMPAKLTAGPVLGVMEITMALGTMALFLLAVDRS